MVQRKITSVDGTLLCMNSISLTSAKGLLTHDQVLLCPVLRIHSIHRGRTSLKLPRPKVHVVDLKLLAVNLRIAWWRRSFCRLDRLWAECDYVVPKLLARKTAERM